MRQLASFNFWNNKSSTSKINVECFLPNGMFISFPDTRADVPLNKIKEQLWHDAARSPLFRLLSTKEEYVFNVVSFNGGTEELIDEQLSLFDVKPVRPYLKVVRRQGNYAAKLINSKISLLIGKQITPARKYDEVDDMRTKYIPFCEKISYERGSLSWEHRAIYTYPPELEEDKDQLPERLVRKLDMMETMGNRVLVTVSMMSANSSLKNIVKTMEIDHRGMLPNEIIDKALRKRAQTLNMTYSENKDEYILKICGRYSFFLGVFELQDDRKEKYVEKPLLQYKYIRDCILYDKKVKLIIVPKHELDVGQPLSSQSQPDLPPVIPPKKSISLWNLTPDLRLKIKVTLVMNINVSLSMLKVVNCGIYHGGEAVCEDKSTSMRDGAHPAWNEYLEFDIAVKDLPRMARFCFSIVGYDQKDRRKARPALIAWVNVPVFNYKGVLREGSDTLWCWQHNTTMDSNSKFLTHPLGTVSQNKNESTSESGAPTIGVEFMKFEYPVIYPKDEEVFEVAAKTIDAASSASNPFHTHVGKMRKEIEDVIKKDVLVDMMENEKELLWKLRMECYEAYPESLPKLLQCVKWSSAEHVSQIRILLQSWRVDIMEVEIALDLLDYKFPDTAVRKLAVKVLDRLSDNDLEMYLLHLVQALKYESYMDCDLARYLLTRALNNRRIGHFLFWHLKAEVTDPEHSVQFSLLLELYCRGAREHIDILRRQVEFINKLKTVTDVLQSGKESDNNNKLSIMMECLTGSANVKAFSNVFSPLDPTVKLKALKPKECKILDSKKKPLWLVFENSDEEGDDIMIIFKNGDDLRQDNLTLLCMRLMDSVWKNAGYDYSLNIYRCLPTGPMVGLIEVVYPSCTLGKIQADKAGTFVGVWRPHTLYQYLLENVSENNEEKCKIYIDNFTLSVIGYSIATYVLGIGDRHNDNIMIKGDSGELFHIDFGHFLGNFKRKFGMKREFVKFVLTDDILYVINKLGKDNEELFKNKCIEAFKVLRSKGNLFISVFAMLLSTGIPELEVPQDLDYLQTSLALDKSETDAITHFKEVYKEAHDNKGKTTMNWMIHNVAHRWIEQ